MKLICAFLSRLDQFVCTTNQWVSYSANMRPTSMMLLKRANYWRTEEVQPVKTISRRTSTPAALWMNDDENLQRSSSSAQQHHSEQWIMVLLAWWWWLWDSYNWSRTHIDGRFFSHFSFPCWPSHINMEVGREMTTNSDERMCGEFLLLWHCEFFSSTEIIMPLA